MAKKTTTTDAATEAEEPTTETAPAPAAPVPYEPSAKEINELIELSHKALDKQSAREVLIRNHAEAQAAG